MLARGTRMLGAAVVLLVLALGGTASAQVRNFDTEHPSSRDVKSACEAQAEAMKDFKAKDEALALRNRALATARGPVRTHALTQRDKARGASDRAKAKLATARKSCTDVKKHEHRLSRQWTRWLVVAGLVLMLAIGFGPGFGMMVGVDLRVSTSKFTAGVWTALLAGTLLGYVVASVIFDFREGLDKLTHSGLAGQYGLLIGGPLGAAVAARGIVGSQLAKSASSKSTGDKKAKLGDIRQIFQNDVGTTDLGDFQYVVFNLVAMVFFLGMVVWRSPLQGLPTIPDVLLGLTSVSALGYVGKKALPLPPATAKLVKAEVAPGAEVTITGGGLLGDNPANRATIVLFDSVPVVPEAEKMTRTDAGEDQIVVKLPERVGAGDHDVFVITPTPARVSAGKLTVKAPANTPA